jgi:hypothetical protein
VREGIRRLRKAYRKLERAAGRAPAAV